MAFGKIKINIVCVGKIKESFFREAIDEYAKRLSRFASFEVVEVPDESDEGEDNAVIQQNVEGERILKKLKGYVILMDSTGKELSSEGIAELIKSQSTRGESEFSFVIGGSRGVSDAIRKTADFTLSFGKVTYPHQLMRVILSEQIYRAMTIINNVKYHK